MPLNSGLRPGSGEAQDGERGADCWSAPLAPHAKEILVREMEAHPYRKVLLSHEEAVLRVAASLPQMRHALDALAGASPAPGYAPPDDPPTTSQAGEILAQFLEFVAFSTPEMKRLVAGER